MNDIKIDRKQRTDFAVDWHKSSTGQGRETINLAGQEVKEQGHMRPGIEMEAYRMHPSGSRVAFLVSYFYRLVNT